jgi:hypothetical protein
VGRGGALLLAVGAVAIGAAGCATQGSGTVSAEKAAVGSSATTPDGTAGTTPVTPTGSAGPTGSTTATTAATTATTAATTAATTPSTTSATKPSATPSSAKPTPKPTPKPSPSVTTGTGWLAGVPIGSNKPGALDPRCMTGRVICVDMSTRTLLWVVDGKPQYGMDVRFGDENNPTRKGQFSLYMKMKDCISTIYHTPMPDAMFFSGGEAVHFSIDFKTYGYAHHSHGCVNVRDRAAVDRLFADSTLAERLRVLSGELQAAPGTVRAADLIEGVGAQAGM